jgi:hypothetical protein
MRSGGVAFPRGAQRDRLRSSTQLLEPKQSGRVYTSVERFSPKDKTSGRREIRCGTEKRPHHPCGVRSVISQRTRSSTCWQERKGSTFALAAWIAANRSDRKSERSNRFLLADSLKSVGGSCSPTRWSDQARWQKFEERRTASSSPGSRLERARCEQAVRSTQGECGPAAREKGPSLLSLAKRQGETTG